MNSFFMKVSRSWRELAFDGQLWSKLDLRAFPKAHPNVLVQLSQVAGAFIQELNLVGHTSVSSAAFIEISDYLSTQPALCGDLCDTTYNQLTSLNLQGCSSLTTRALHHILIRSPLLERLSLRGQHTVTNTTCDVLANYCPKLTHLDLSRCPNMTGDGIHSALLYAASRGERVDLKQLRLSGLRKVSDEMMRMLGKVATSLEVLDLSYARDLHNSAVEAFVACTEEDAKHMETVQLTAHEAGRDSYDTGRYWRRITRLRHLNLSSCVLLTDHACSHLAHSAPNLEFLELAGIGPELRDNGLVRLLKTTPFIRRLDLEDATEVSDDVLAALTPSVPASSPNPRSAPPPPEPGHALEHLIVSYTNIETEALSDLVRACTRLRVLEADNTRMTGLTLKEFVHTALERKIADAKIVAVDCRSVGEYCVKEVAAHTRPRMGWRSWHARKLRYLDARDGEGLGGVGQDECDPYRVVVKTFYSWQTVDAVQAAREKRRKSGSRRSANSTGSGGVSEDFEVPTPGRARWWSPGGRRSTTAPNTPTLLDLNTDRGEGCTIM
jgi:F-box and leucine-rich repeat protein 2/20